MPDLNDEQRNAANEIFTKDPGEWTPQELSYIQSLVSKGFRAQLKALRNGQ